MADTTLVIIPDGDNEADTGMPIEVDVKVSRSFIAGYYRATVDDDPIKEGMLVYASHYDEYNYSKKDKEDQEKYRVHFVCGASGYTCGLSGFLSAYEYEPDGERIREQQIAAIAGEIKELGQKQVTFNKQAAAFQPHVTDDGEFTATADNADVGTAMVPMGASPDTAKKTLAVFRNDVAKLKNAVVAKTEELKSFMAEKQAIIKAQITAITAGIQEKVGELQQMVEKAQTAIWTINLYLGKDEQIVQIKKGKPAPKNTPITIRQLVLFMDEEIAACDKFGDADYGGIDARNIENFDKWLLDRPEHLQQIIPEPKGIVVLKPRRNTKSYGDVWTQKAMDEANKVTYFLIRNGTSLYRIWTDFDVGDTLLPSETKFMNMFYRDDYDYQTNGKVRNPIKPGSEEYMRAMDRVDAERQHFYRVALIMQGLLDRTKILHPLPIPRLNVLNPDEYVGSEGEEYLRFVYDAENGKVLPDGWPKYDDWLDEANKDICVGQRIVGLFHFRYSDKYSSRDAVDQRIIPSGASMPKDLELHTIESRGEKPGSFYFYYKRTDTVWRRGWREESGDAKVRARCTIYADDSFLINFDAANVTIKAMEYYIGSRLHRHRYMDMIPLLKRVLEVKKQEIKDEEPFMKLLVGQIMLEYSVDMETAEAAVPELVKWWKFKNQTHRALLSDDSQAIKMILAEYGIRQKRSLERSQINGDSLVQQLLDTIHKTEPNVVFIGHKRSNEYAVLVAHNDEDVFVKEQIWAINRSSNCAWDQRVRMKESKEWRLVDNRWQRWAVLYKHDRFDIWIRDARAKHYLTDIERQQGIDIAEELVTERQEKRWSNTDRERYTDDDWKDKVIPLAIALHHKDDDFFRIYYCDRPAILPTESLLSNYPYEPSIAVKRIVWTRDAKGVVKFSIAYDNNDHICSSMGNPPWRKNYDGAFSEGKGARMLKEWPANVQEIYRQQELAKVFIDRRRKLDDVPRSAAHSVEAALEKREWTKIYDEYIKEYGDPELWEDHKKSEKIKVRRYKTLLSRFELLIERNIDCNGKTLATIWEETSELLLESVKAGNVQRKRRYFYSGTDDTPGEEELNPEDADIVISHTPIPQKPLALEEGWDKKPKKGDDDHFDD